MGSFLCDLVVFPKIIARLWLKSSIINVLELAELQQEQPRHIYKQRKPTLTALSHLASL